MSMRFSIFDDDGTLGQLPTGWRTVTITGYAGLDTYFIGQATIRSAVEQTFAANGIGISGLRLSTNGYTVNFTLDVNGSPDHSNEDVRRITQSTFEAVEYIYRGAEFLLGPVAIFAAQGSGWSGRRKLLRNIDTQVLASTSPIGSNTDPRTQARSTGTSRVPDPPPGTSAVGDSDAWNKFWGNLGFTVAPTVGVVVLVGGLGLILLTRR